MNKHSPLKAAVNKVGLKKIPAECMPTAFYTGIFVLVFNVDCIFLSFIVVTHTIHRSTLPRQETPDQLKMWPNINFMLNSSHVSFSDLAHTNVQTVNVAGLCT